MDYQGKPQFSDESLKELTQILVNFFLKNLPEESLSNIEVEIKFNQPLQDTQTTLLQEQTRLQEPQTIARGRCIQGEGTGCGPGFRWGIELTSNEVE